MIHKLIFCSMFKYFFLTVFLLAVIACDNTHKNEQRMLMNAKKHLDNGELMAASIELRNTLQENTENAEARYLLGNVSLKAGDLKTAEKEFRQAADAGWDQEAVQLQLARIFISKKAYKKLLIEIETVDTWSVDTRANIAGLRALAEAGLNNVTKAKNTLDEGRSLNKDAIQVLRTTAILQLAGILEGDASSTLETALSLNPDNPEILLLHASNDIQNKNLSRATDTYKRIIALDPAKLVTANGRKARIALSRLQIIQKDYNTAEKTLAPLLKISDKDPEVNYLTGLLAFKQGSLNRAEDHLRKILTVAPDNTQVQLLMGKIKYAQKNFDQAAHYLSSYLNSIPNNNDVRKLLTNTYIILNQPNKARKTLQTALTANPYDATALTLLSQIEFDTGDTDAGITALRKAIKHNPDNAQLHKQLAKAYTRTGHNELAKNEINIYHKLSDDTEEAHKLSISNYLQSGKIDKALGIANQILLKDPENPDTLALIGSLYANSGNKQQARTHFNKAIMIQEDHTAAIVGLARIERNNGDIQKAITLYKSLINTNKAGTLPMLELSEIAAQQKRTNDMISWLERARNSSPTETRARMILAKYYLRNAQPEKAEIYTNEVIKQFPEEADLITLHAKVLIAQKRYNEALPHLKKLVIKSPESSATQNLLGEAYLRQRVLVDARKHLLNALTLQQSNTTTLSLLAETELIDGNPDLSLEYATKLQKQLPDHYLGYMLEGDAWMIKQNYDRAHHAYDSAWKQQQTAPLAKRLFMASKHTSSPSMAVRPIHIWLKNNPDDYSTRLYLATIYQSASKNDKAIVEYEKVLKKSPENSTVLNNLAWLYSLNDNPKAMDMAERAYRFSPENPSILDTYGWILIRNGQVEKGQRLIKQAMNAIPGNLDIRYHYAITLLKTGKNIEAKEILEELLAQDKPFNGQEEATQLLKNL